MSEQDQRPPADEALERARLLEVERGLSAALGGADDAVLTVAERDALRERVLGSGARVAPRRRWVWAGAIAAVVALAVYLPFALRGSAPGPAGPQPDDDAFRIRSGGGEVPGLSARAVCVDGGEVRALEPGGPSAQGCGGELAFAYGNSTGAHAWITILAITEGGAVEVVVTSQAPPNADDQALEAARAAAGLREVRAVFTRRAPAAGGAPAGEIARWLEEAGVLSEVRFVLGGIR